MGMVVSNISINGSTAEIYFIDIPTEILSALRRIIIEEVPTMAVDNVLVLENNSILHDEVLAHRIAMIPFNSEKAIEKYNSPEKCVECLQCEGCYSRAYLEVSNEDSERKVVYAREIRTEDPEIAPAIPDIPIIVLGKGQKISMELELRLGRGKEHIKWSPVSISVLLSVPSIEYDLTSCSNLSECLKCISSYNEKLANQISEEKKGSMKLEKFQNTSLLRFCEEKACSGCIKVNYLDNERILRFESSGSLSPQTILKISLEILREKLENLEKMISEIEGEA
ncbi:MAG: DNA-directed RNA polymerase subunit D [Fervidicoccaceae archaeon]|jgi:DNA-directed RNA polymerase subunit D